MKFSLKAILLLFICFIFSYNHCVAQIIDTAIGKTVDADKEQIVKYDIKTKEKVNSIQLYGFDKRGCLLSVDPCKTDRLYDYSNATFQPTPTQDTNGTVSFKLPPLHPNRRYIAYISTIGKTPPEFEKVLKAMCDGKIDDAKEIYIGLEEKFTTYNTVTNPCSNCKQDFGIIPFDKFKEYYTSEGWYKYVDDYYEMKLKNELVKLEEQIELCSVLINDDIFRKIILSSQICLSCDTSVWNYRWMNKGVEPFKFLLGINNFNDKLVFNGFIRYDSLLFGGSIKDVKLSERLSNLKWDLKNLSEQIEILQYFKYSNGINKFDNLILALQNIFDCYRRNYTNLENYAQLAQDAQNNLKKSKQNLDDKLSRIFTVPSKVYEANTFTYKFDTRSNYTIQSDIGFLAFYDPTININSDKSNSYFNRVNIAPFIGFHVNFRPMDTEIPFKSIKARLSFWDHLSFHSGALLTSLKLEGERDGLIGNTAIFMGLGYAFGHAGRIHAGSIFYRKEDPNPLVDSKSLGAMFYIGGALDLRLKPFKDAFKEFFK